VYGPDDAICERCRDGKHGCHWGGVSRRGRPARVTKRKTKVDPEPREVHTRDSKSAAKDRLKVREYVGDRPPPHSGPSREREETSDELLARLKDAPAFRKDLGLQAAFDQVALWEQNAQYAQEMLETARKFRDRKLKEKGF
jgi:hypothetical protein